MKVSEVRVRGFRALRDVLVAFDDLTILVGTNSAGKSTLLKALKFFFEPEMLDRDDVYGRVEDRSVSVQVTFTDLTQADRAAFGVYAHGEQMILTKAWDGGEIKLTGRGLQFGDFDEIREAAGRERTRLYRQLRENQPDLNLPEATNIEAVEAAMLTWEMDNPERCATVEQDAGRLFGYTTVGQSVLGQRIKFVFVPGVQDASQEAVERRGSILERLLSAIAEQRAAANEELAALEIETRARYEEVVNEAHGPTLRELAESLEEHMRRYVPTAGISLQPVAPQMNVAPPGVALRGGEERDFSDLGRQGHGFQRTFIIAALEYLAEAAAAEGDVDDDRPTLFLAIEEPELYQHPPRARHFFRTLRSLAFDTADVQVAYATHSPYFVAPENFDNLRIFRRVPAEADMPAGVSVTQATLEAVNARIPEIGAGDLARYVARTMASSFAEAFFARGALLVEGPTDAAVFHQAARMLDQDFAPRGISCVTVSKSVIPAARAVLEEFGIPTYVVFDGDAHQIDQEPCDACGRPGQQRRAAAARLNRKLLRAIGGDESDFPDTAVEATWACFADDLETFLEQTVERFADLASEIAAAHDWKKKSPETYSEALEQLGAEEVPQLVHEIIDHVVAAAERIAVGDEIAA